MYIDYINVINCLVYMCTSQCSQNLPTYRYSCETCRVYNATIPLSSLQVSDLYVVPTRFYESLNEQIWMHVFHTQHINVRYEHVTSIRLLLKARALIWYPI